MSKQLKMWEEPSLGVPADGPLWNIPDEGRHVHMFHVTFFKDVHAKKAREVVISLQELQQIILAARAPSKEKLPLLKLARFGDQRSAKDSLRHNANILFISGIELDYDGEECSFEMALAHLHRLDCHALIYTTPSHTPDKPRWRILMPTSRAYHRGMRGLLVQSVDGWFGKNRFFDWSSKTLSQAFWFGNTDQCVLIQGHYFVDHRFDKTARRSDNQETILFELEKDAGKGTAKRWAEWAEGEWGRGWDEEDIELKIACALAVIPADYYWDWLYVGAAIYDTLGEDGWPLFQEWSQKSRKYNERACRKKWEGFVDMHSHHVDTIFWHADQHDSLWRDTYQQMRREVQP